jgi:hypothetical protein
MNMCIHVVTYFSIISTSSNILVFMLLQKYILSYHEYLLSCSLKVRILQEQLRYLYFSMNLFLSDLNVLTSNSSLVAICHDIFLKEKLTTGSNTFSSIL